MKQKTTVTRGVGVVVLAGGVRRFRPILLTSLATFFGLAPMILETSVQARLLIPMAVSLGFGVMLATFVLPLLIVPAAYIALDSVKRGWRVLSADTAAPGAMSSAITTRTTKTRSGPTHSPTEAGSLRA